MDVTITELRRNLFNLVENALAGKQVRVTHKGRRLRIVPEKPVSKLDRITKLDCINPRISEAEASRRIRAEMEKEWEEDWKDL